MIYHISWCYSLVKTSIFELSSGIAYEKQKIKNLINFTYNILNIKKVKKIFLNFMMRWHKAGLAAWKFSKKLLKISIDSIVRNYIVFKEY